MYEKLKSLFETYKCYIVTFIVGFTVGVLCCYCGYRNATKGIDGSGVVTEINNLKQLNKTAEQEVGAVREHIDRATESSSQASGAIRNGQQSIRNSQQSNREIQQGITDGKELLQSIRADGQRAEQLSDEIVGAIQKRTKSSNVEQR